MKMISIKNILQVTIGVVLALSLPRCNSPESKVKLKVEPTAAAGWENLSDPEHIAWHTYGRNGLGKAWKMEDSVIHLDAAVKEGWQTKDGGDIVTNNEYENFDLKLQWKISEGGNSGIMFYVKEDTAKYKYPWESGPEMQVADNEKNEDGKVVKSR